jgi:hypothetical protein
VINDVFLSAIKIDNTPPSITMCPPDQVVAADANRQAVLPDFTPGIVATDNCTSPANLQFTQNPLAGIVVGLGQTGGFGDRPDRSGNQSKCFVNYTVADQTPPSIHGCPANIVTNVNSSNCTAVVSWDLPIANDNCGEPTIERTNGPETGSAFANGSVTTIEYTATDSANLISTCSFTVTVLASPDMNNDNVVNLLDLPTFVNVLVGTDTTQWRVARADVNCDGFTDGGDIQPFIDLLIP